MDEARRFLRYVTPGLSFVVQTILFLWILLPAETQNVIKELRNDSGIGIAFAALLASGGVGYLFSMIHHICHRLHGPVDHSDLIDRLRRQDVLCLLDARSGKEIPKNDKPSRLDAWEMVAALWHERLGKNKTIKGADPRATSLSDLVHSTGTARVASALAWITALLIVYLKAECSLDACDRNRFILMNLIAFGLLCMHWYSYRKTGHAAQRVIEQILYDALVEESDSKKAPVQTRVVLSSKKKCWYSRLYRWIRCRREQ